MFFVFYTTSMSVRAALLFFVFIIPSFLFFVVFVAQDVSATEEIGGVARNVMLAGVEACLQNAYDDACYADLCAYEPGYLCAEELLDVAVEAAGPVRAMDLLHSIMVSPVFAITTDGHLLSHVIGRTTSRIFGSSGENFLRCPHDFNDGCYHGFFEDTLVKVDDPVAVAVGICENMPPATTSDKERSYCYHGAGHVFLMNENYALDASIDACLAVPGRWHDVCLSGVFMENAWPTRAWEEKRVNFRKDDPLYPCNALAPEISPTCYTEHYSYLMHEYSTSFDELVAICLQAGDNVADCLSGFGLMLQNTQRTDVVFENFGIADRSHMEKIIFLCDEFPDAYKSSCYIPLVGALLNFDYPSMHRINTFCGGIAAEHRAACFNRAGSYLDHLGNKEMKQSACAEAPVMYQQDCLDPHARDTGVVISDFVEESATVDYAVGDIGDQHGHMFTKVTHFFVSFIKYLSSLFVRPVSAQGVADSADVSTISFLAIERCISKQDGRAECYASLCEYEPGYLCAEDLLQEAVRGSGPELGMQMLGEMAPSESFPFSIADEGHGLAHAVGREAARHLGGTGEIFLRCPTSFDYGCNHGFLEIALIDAPSPAEAVTRICESLPKKPEIGRPNCYHGSGHGVMMNESYDLHAALAVCDQVSDSYGCWSGVFMENVNGYITRRIEEWYPEHNSFDADNPHAPCDAVDEKYREICYRVHMPYLAAFFDYDLQSVVNTCLDAGAHTEDCVFGFGWHVLFEGIQNPLYQDPDMDFIEKTIYLCNQFPERFWGICYRPAINQISVSYGAERTFEFCEKIDERYVSDCYGEIGRRLDDLILHPDEKAQVCAKVPERYRDYCMTGKSDGENIHTDNRSYGESGVTPRNDLSDDAVEESFLIVFIRSILQFLSGVINTSAQQVSSQAAFDVDDVSGAGNDLAEGVAMCLMMEGKESKASCYASLCEYESGYICAEDIMRIVSITTDPGQAMVELDSIVWGGKFTIDASSAHNLGHIVGRETARTLGVVGEAFLQCPIDFDYACQHGFVEYALGVVDSPVEAVKQMCGTMPDIPRVAKGNCYHGAGHALMMNYSYNLHSALEKCDMFDSRWDGYCETGAFMENVNAYLRSYLTEVYPEHNTFRDDDPLAPCSTIAERYKEWCYVSHVPYIMDFYQDDLKKIVETCVGVDNDNDKRSCAYSVGAYSRTPGAQRRLLRSDDFTGNILDDAHYICSQFLEDTLRVGCYTGVLNQNIIDYGFESMYPFCEKIEESNRRVCWQIVGRQVGNIASDQSEREAHCLVSPEEYRNDCLGLIHFDEEMVSAAEPIEQHVGINDSVDTKPVYEIFFIRLLRFFLDIFSG